MARRHALIIALLAAAGMVAGCNEKGEQKAAGGNGAAAAQETPVSVVTMKQRELPFTARLPGRAVAFQTAEIRPQVSGVVTSVAFKEGGTVSKGELLYQIEDRSYSAALAQSQAAVAKAQAAVPTAETNLARYQRLVNSGATQIEYENAKVTLLQAKADVESAQAALRSAEINLDYTKIRAPFDGIASATGINVGNVVTANQTTSMMTLRQINPIYIQLTESSTNLLKLERMLASGDLKGSPKDAVIRLTLEDGKEYDHTGTLDMSEMAVSETTGTFNIRAVFENPNRRILPGMYVRATVEIGRETGYLIPQRAATRDARGKLTAQFVSAENTVEVRTFEDARTSNNSWLVTKGIKDGDKLIVDGFQWIGPGAKVKPTEVQIDEDGLVMEQTAQAAPAAPTAAN